MRRAPRRSRVVKLTRVLWHLLGGTRGGPMRIRIIALLRERPLNTNQVTRALGIDYKTAEHHLRVLRENRIASPSGDKYGAVYILTRDMEESMDEFDRIAAKLGLAPPPKAPPPTAPPSSVPPPAAPRPPPREGSA
jgi:DNA-binding transcriptional ArsR family regulator